MPNMIRRTLSRSAHEHAVWDSDDIHILPQSDKNDVTAKTLAHPKVPFLASANLVSIKRLVQLAQSLTAGVFDTMLRLRMMISLLTLIVIIGCHLST